jgi:hypothetical protein
VRCGSEVICPLLGVKHTALLAISTPQSETNWYSELINLKDQHGRHLFDTIQLGLRCAKCAAENRACSHKLFMSPAWKTVENTAKVDAIMATNPTLRDRETRGEASSEMRTILKATEVDLFSLRSRFVFPVSRPRVLFTAIDPAGGGSLSDYTILTGTLCGQKPVVRLPIHTVDEMRSECLHLDSQQKLVSRVGHRSTEWNTPLLQTHQPPVDVVSDEVEKKLDVWRKSGLRVKGAVVKHHDGKLLVKSSSHIQHEFKHLRRMDPEIEGVLGGIMCQHTLLVAYNVVEPVVEHLFVFARSSTLTHQQVPISSRRHRHSQVLTRLSLLVIHCFLSFPDCEYGSHPFS